jgi:hypothetical protein
MKRILVSTLLLLAATTLALGQSVNKRSHAEPDAVGDSIIAKEKQVLDAIKKKDAAGFKALVSDDAIVVGPQGTMTGGDAGKMLFSPDYSMVSATIDDPKVTMIDKDAAIITYKVTGTETYKGQSKTETAYSTSVWANRGGKWVAVFHQETSVQQ